MRVAETHTDVWPDYFNEREDSTLCQNQENPPFEEFESGGTNNRLPGPDQDIGISLAGELGIFPPSENRFNLYSQNSYAEQRGNPSLDPSRNTEVGIDYSLIFHISRNCICRISH